MDLKAFAKKLNPEQTKLDEPMSKHTTVGIGGPADIYYEAHTVDELVETIKLAKEHEVPFTIIGDGSNILVSDEGIRGIVIRNMSNSVEIHDDTKSDTKSTSSTTQSVPTARWESDSKKGTFMYEFKDLNYDESDKPRVIVTIDCGASLPGVTQYLFDQGITGLQWFGGIPGTIGGATFNNIHGGSRFFSEFLESVEVLTPDMEIKTLTLDEIGDDYNKTRFHDSAEILLRTTLKLFKGDVEKARYTASEWAKRKSIQPRNSPGCAFSNLTQEQKEKFDYPTTSMGYVNEHVIGMSGFQVGDAGIQEPPHHHAFIVNYNKATAKDYLAVMREVQKRTEEKLSFKPKPEIFLLGFDKKEIADVVN